MQINGKKKMTRLVPSIVDTISDLPGVGFRRVRDSSRFWSTVNLLSVTLMAVVMLSFIPMQAGSDYEQDKREWDAARPAEALAQLQAALRQLQAEQEKLRNEQEKLQAEREKLRLEQERSAKEENLRIEQEKLQAERERLRLEQERLARQKAEQERLAEQRAEQERVRLLLAEQERLRAQEAEQERLRQLYTDGKEFRDCDGCPVMVVVPAGKFRMGSPASERSRNPSEGPLHEVTIAQPFAAGKYEVTFDQWDACVSEGGCSHVPHDAGWGRGNRPVVNVNWHDAGEYVDWLSHKTGKRYRLLSEAEWEYAARAGTRGPFHFGRTISTDQANYRGFYTYGGGSPGVYRARTVSVGRFPGNAFGLHDVHGNVWEWVEDCWHGNYQGAPSDGSAWTSGGDCEVRVIRGGSQGSRPKDIRSAIRSGNVAENRNKSNGFRVGWSIAL